jgi:hypothetical protein
MVLQAEELSSCNEHSEPGLHINKIFRYSLLQEPHKEIHACTLLFPLALGLAVHCTVTNQLRVAKIHNLVIREDPVQTTPTTPM